MSTDVAKLAAARTALDTFVEGGMTLALGSGSTAHAFVRLLGERVAAGLAVTCTASSRGTTDVARASGIATVDPNDLAAIDLCIDGADEVDGAMRLIKGGGACLLWEKILARAAARMVVICDESKRVDTLGRFPLPVEVVRFGWVHTARAISATLTASGIAPESIARRMAGDAPLVTDSGNFIVDCRCGAIADAAALEAALNMIPGVVENGLFTREAAVLVVGGSDGVADVLARQPTAGRIDPAT